VGVLVVAFIIVAIVVVVIVHCQRAAQVRTQKRSE
jgi:hypothetical protein